VSTLPPGRKSELRFLVALAYAAVDLVAVLPLALCALASRGRRRPVDVGLGPCPLINNVHHAKALRGTGWSAETYVSDVYYITDEFDHDLSLPRPFNYLSAFRMALLCFGRYRCLYLSFEGGPLGGTQLLRRIEPQLLRLAGIRTVVLPYGADVQDLSRSKNPLQKHGTSQCYPDLRLRRRRIASMIDLWTRWADHIFAGVEWVDYLYYWDRLTIGHFSIDTDAWAPSEASDDDPTRPLRVLHAPNHRPLKGSGFFIDAVATLREEGHAIELELIERVPNDEVHRAIQRSDIVADQLVVGWYAMFAIEAMACGKPVLCAVRDDLEDLYVRTGLLQPGELPLVRCQPETVTDVLRELCLDRKRTAEIGLRSRDFVLRHHSLEALGRVFTEVHAAIGLEASA
jgi:glycosyltransferase involved in cell wall biosynthesis